MSKSKSLTPKKYTIAYVAFALIFSLVLIAFIIFSSRIERAGASETLNTELPATGKYPTVIIDAGHGGEDGGTIGKNGIYEKDLNLMIAKDLCQMLRANGIEVVMTRETDVMLYDRNVDYRGRKKMLDLSARLKIGEKYEDCIFVSIHMNAFPQEQYRGLQVYYSPNAESSAILAERIQSTVCEYIQQDNTRKIKKANGSIFILDRIKNPAVLIECGFLSNPEECSLLSTEEYRQKLTLAIFCGICEYFSEDNS